MNDGYEKSRAMDNRICLCMLRVGGASEGEAKGPVVGILSH